MALTNAQYALVSELLDEVHDIKDGFRDLQTKVYDLEDENYRLRERISELYKMINDINCVDDVEELKAWMEKIKSSANEKMLDMQGRLC